MSPTPLSLFLLLKLKQQRRISLEVGRYFGNDISSSHLLGLVDSEFFLVLSNLHRSTSFENQDLSKENPSYYSLPFSSYSGIIIIIIIIIMSKKYFSELAYFY